MRSDTAFPLNNSNNARWCASKPVLYRQVFVGKFRHRWISQGCSRDVEEECDILANELLEEYFTGVSWLFFLRGVAEVQTARHTAKTASRICRVRAGGRNSVGACAQVLGICFQACPAFV